MSASLVLAGEEGVERETTEMEEGERERGRAKSESEREREREKRDYQRWGAGEVERCE